ncbi:MAG: PQQ-binding-like beta-propeller repeat protein, partial [Psychrosphaera sp.]|nr:PQQ-binding-like beta-propeller repeat protein [Psychrosphaera sp.]
KTLGNDVGSVRVGASGQLFIGQSRDTLSLNPDGNKLWSSLFGAGGDSIGNNDTLYYFTNGVTEAYFGAVDADGTHLFTGENLDLWTGVPVISAQGTIFGSTASTGLALLSESGSESIVFNPPNVGFCTPVVGNDDVLYVASRDRVTQTGRFYAVNSNTGSAKWSIDSNNTMCNSALIGSDGTVYFKDVGGILHAIETNSSGLANSPWPRNQSNNRNSNSVNP